MHIHGTTTPALPAFAGLGFDLSETAEFAATLRPWLEGLLRSPAPIVLHPHGEALPFSPRERLFMAGRLARAP